MKPINDVFILKCIPIFVYYMDKRIIQIANKLKQLRIDKGYVSAEFFAWEHKIPRVQYWRMEKGTNFTFKNLLRILDAHQISLKEFFSDID